jgi:hypothetical protein
MVKPPAACAPFAAASITPVSPPVTSTARCAATSRPIVSAAAYSAGETSLPPITPTIRGRTLRPPPVLVTN